MSPDPKADPFRQTIAPAEGPNATGYDDLVKAAHPEREEPVAPLETDAAIDSAMRDDDALGGAPRTPHAPLAEED